MKLIKQNAAMGVLGTTRTVMSLTAVAILLAGCNAEDGSPTAVLSNTGFSLYCPNVGIAADTCVLSDPENPYAKQTVNDSIKWTLASAAASERDKFYVWATAQAHDPKGENQYNTALSLHELYHADSNILAQAQAKLAYRSVLDNYFTASNSVSEFVAGTDFSFGDWGSGSTLDGAYATDTDYDKVYQVAPGWGWGGNTAALAMTNFSAGFAANYQNLVFKVKSLPTGDVYVKFPLSGAGNDGELALSLATYGAAVPGTTGWTQVTVPLSVFNGAASDTEFAIMGGWGNGGTFLISDIGFTGNTTSGNMIKDSIDGFVAVYYPQTESLTQVGFVRGLAGGQLVEPDTLTNLYGSQSAADAAVSSWGFTYNTTSNTLQ